jgi:hypothetical protein
LDWSNLSPQISPEVRRRWRQGAFLPQQLAIGKVSGASAITGPSHLQPMHLAGKWQPHLLCCSFHSNRLKAALKEGRTGRLKGKRTRLKRFFFGENHQNERGKGDAVER